MTIKELFNRSDKQFLEEELINAKKDKEEISEKIIEILFLDKNFQNNEDLLEYDKKMYFLNIKISYITKELYKIELKEENNKKEI